MATTTDCSASILKKRKIAERKEASTDHRKRRRNRTTQSCLNCHGSKRMCDRKRPACSRCTKLGLSGICVYEVDDINQRDVTTDETTHLKSRIAELERFIREYKKKPQPHWAIDLHDDERFSRLFSIDPDSTDSDSRSGVTEENYSSTADTACHVSSASSPSESDSQPSTPTSQLNDVPLYFRNQETSSLLFFPNRSSSDALSALCPISSAEISSPVIPTGIATAGEGIDSIFALGGVGLFADDDSKTPERVFSRIIQPESQRPDIAAIGHCQCARKPSAYPILLELSCHVHKAIDALNALPEHQITHPNNPCHCLQHILEFDSSLSTLVDPALNPLVRSLSMHLHHNAKPDCAATLDSDSPLQRVLAARRAKAAGASASRTPSLAGDAGAHGTRKPRAYRATSCASPGIGSIQSLWLRKDLSASVSAHHDQSTSEIDRFMTWDATTHIDWPRAVPL